MNLLVSMTLASFALAAAAAAQGCGVNVYPLHLVDAQGVPRPLDANQVATYDDEAVYMAFDPTTPTGTYYVHVTDRIDGITDEVLSMNDPMDRFVSVTNTNNVITLSLPFTQNPNPAVFGRGLNGQGDSVLLSPLRRGTTEPCTFKAWFGDTWELGLGPSWPHIVRGGGINPATNQCMIVSLGEFRIGDGTPSDVTGSVFHDLDRDGVRDAGEPPMAGWTVQLVNGMGSTQTTTDANGDYAFVDVAAGNYSVELILQGGYSTTTSSAFPVEVCGCANVAAGQFGVAQVAMACDGHTIGYWRNNHGTAYVQQYGILATYPALCLRNATGQHVAPATIQAHRSFLQGANSVNMAYMLSAQLVAMHCNVIVGFVDPMCMVRDAQLGDLSIFDLMQRAVASLCAHGYTPAGSPFRAEQEALKNALDNANNNRNWL